MNRSNEDLEQDIKLLTETLHIILKTLGNEQNLSDHARNTLRVAVYDLPV